MVARIMASPGTSAAFARFLNTKFNLPEIVNTPASALTEHAGVDWKTWNAVRDTMLYTPYMNHAQKNDLGGTIDRLL